MFAVLDEVLVARGITSLFGCVAKNCRCVVVPVLAVKRSKVQVGFATCNLQ